MRRNSPLRVLAWIVVAFFALVGFADFIGFLFGVNLFQLLGDFVTSTSMTITGVLPFAPLLAASRENNGGGGPPWERYERTWTADERTHRMKLNRIKRWLGGGLGVIFALLLLLAVLEPASTFMYWTGEAIAAFFAGMWWIVSTFALAIIGLLAGIAMQPHLPRLTYRVAGDPRQKKVWIHPRSIEVVTDIFLRVEDWNDNEYWTRLSETVWEGWHVRVAGQVVPERDGRRIWLKDKGGEMSNLKKMYRKYERQKQENEELRYQQLQLRRQQQLVRE